MKKRTFVFSQVLILSLFLGVWVAIGALPALPQTTAAAPAKLPPAREIIDNHVRAIGGRNAVLRYKSAYAKGRYEIAGQVNAEIEIFNAAPNKTLVKLSFPGVGEHRRGFDGQVGWELNPMAGPSLVTGKELDQMRHNADFYGDLHEEKNFQSIEAVGIEEFQGNSCYKLRLVTKSGVAYLEFFDVKSAFLVGRVLTVATPAGSMEVANVLGDYKRFGGVAVPTKSVSRYTIAGRPIEEVITITTVEYDKVDPKIFELPEQIKALIAKRGP